MSNALYVAWRSGLPEDGGWWSPVGRLERVAGLYRFTYTRGAQSPAFEPFPGMPDLHTAEDCDRFLVGYVPRNFARDFTTLCFECVPDFVHVTVERVNTGAPMQMRVLCRMRACWPEGFRPCRGETFQPIAAEAGTR